MNKAWQPILQPLNTLLTKADKRIAAIVLLIALNLILAIWIGVNIHQVRQTQQDTLDLSQANQSILEKLDAELHKQRALEDGIKKTLASRQDLNGLILSLESTAPALGVTLSDANQIYVETNREKLPHSLIQYNVQGSYANVLQFVAESLNKHDALVLKSLSFRRSDPLVSNLQINLEWALYYR